MYKLKIWDKFRYSLQKLLKASFGLISLLKFGNRQASTSVQSETEADSLELSEADFFDQLDPLTSANLMEPVLEPPVDFAPPTVDTSEWMKGELIQEMDRFIRTQRSKHTQRAYRGDLKQFISWLRVERFNPNSIDALLSYRDYLVADVEAGGLGLAKVSSNRKFATVRSFLNWLKSRGFMHENPAIWVKNFRAKTESPTQGFSDIQVSEILKMPNRHTRSGVMHLFILHLLFYMGLRRGEICDLRCSHIRKTRVGDGLINTITVPGKGDKERTLPIPKAVARAMELYFSRFDLQFGADEYLFKAVRNNITKRFDQSITGNSIAYIVKKYAKMAGIEADVSPHSCRATCISNALEQGATQKSVQHMAGWSSTLMIERYDKRETKLRDSAVHVVSYPDS